MSKKERPGSEDINIGNGPEQFVRKHESAFSNLKVNPENAR